MAGSGVVERGVRPARVGYEPGEGARLSGLSQVRRRYSSAIAQERSFAAYRYLRNAFLLSSYPNLMRGSAVDSMLVTTGGGLDPEKLRRPSAPLTQGDPAE